MTPCVRATCAAELPDASNYCHTCGAPQAAPCPVCGSGGDTGVGLHLSVGQCPRCRSFLMHCPDCRKPFPIGAARCDNSDWGCSGTALVAISQSFGGRGIDPQRTYGLAEDRERRPAEGTTEFRRAWRLELPDRRSLSDVVIAHGRAYAVNLTAQRVLSVPLWIDAEIEPPARRFGFDDLHDRIERSGVLGLLRTPVVHDLAVRGARLAFLVRPRPITLHDGRQEQAPDAVAILLDASTLQPIQQSRRQRIVTSHLGERAWLLAHEHASGTDANRFGFVLASADSGETIAERDVAGTLILGVGPVEIAGSVFVACQEGIVEIALEDGTSILHRLSAPRGSIRALTVIARTLLVWTAGEQIGHHRLLILDRTSHSFVEGAALGVPVDGPPAVLDDTLYLLDDQAKTLRAFVLGDARLVPSPNLNVRLRDQGDTQALALVRSGNAFHVIRKVRSDQGYQSFQVEQVRPTDRGIVGYHRLRSSDSSFAYADGRLIVVDEYEGTILALEVFPS